MRRLVTTISSVLAMMLILGSIAFAWTPPGQRGYEGQPGNQGEQHSN
jgi:hypothetical protein